MGMTSLERLKNWLVTPVNSLHLQLTISVDDVSNQTTNKQQQSEAYLVIPKLSTSAHVVGFYISLLPPHSIRTNAPLLEEVEAESITYAGNESDQMTSLEDMLLYLTNCIDATDEWSKPMHTSSKGKSGRVEDNQSESSAQMNDDNFSNFDDDDDADLMNEEFSSFHNAGADDEDDDGAWSDVVETDATDNWGESESKPRVKVEISSSARSKDIKNDQTAESPQISSGSIEFSHRHYVVLTQEDCMKMLRSMVESIINKYLCSTTAALEILRQNQWDIDMVMEKLRTTSLLALAQEANVSASLNPDRFPSSSHSTTILCPVCFDDVPLLEAVVTNCGHAFCASCFTVYLTTASESGRLILKKRCPDPECKELLGEGIFEMLCDEETFQIYEKHLLDTFISEYYRISYCPKPDCGLVNLLGGRSGIPLKSEIQTHPISVMCKCGDYHCFACHTEAHAPATCEEAAHWKARADMEGLSMKFILDNTKPCPKCGVRIKKEGGCMHMSCSNCRHGWCWQCGRDDHHEWACNRPPYEFDIDVEEEKDPFEEFAMKNETLPNNTEINKNATQATAKVAKGFQNNPAPPAPTANDNHNIPNPPPIPDVQLVDVPMEPKQSFIASEVEELDKAVALQMVTEDDAKDDVGINEAIHLTEPDDNKPEITDVDADLTMNDNENTDENNAPQVLDIPAAEDLNNNKDVKSEVLIVQPVRQPLGNSKSREDKGKKKIPIRSPRYLWYFERTQNQHGSEANLAKLRKATLERQSELIKNGMTVQQANFLLHGVDLVIECRRVLKWTYVHAFFMRNKSERELFEYQQKDLETFTEKLNGYIEGDVHALETNRQNVLFLTTSLTKYLDNMLNRRS